MILSSIDSSLRTFPFPHVCVQEAFDHNISLAVLEWLEKDAPWRLKIADFYEQYEFSFADVNLPENIKPIFSLTSLESLRKKIQKIFETKLSNQIDITAHKLVEGQRIRIHNDFIPNRETHRVLIQLNRGWAEENGGVLMIFRSRQAIDLHSVFIPAHNTSVAFEISPTSFHAVSPISSGDRYTLVFSFYREIE
jgi:Rps23 Pro-64 3,4-dihydroxylase Tpa1-like proline 4-hydroxylase